ncbi:MAG TPA: T9SS type A sorting domain-containing protein [Chitinophagales bacterium]|nr:T9SS type A sorting domain-containing protein [Chitinophagales bacterium]
MKTKATLLALLLVLCMTVNAQFIPNGSFELWNDTLPVGWSVTETMLLDGLVPAGTRWTMRDTIERRHQSASVKLTTCAGMGIAGVLVLGEGDPADIPNGGYESKGIAYINRPDTLFFAYKYEPMGNDTALVFAGLTKNGAQVMQMSQRLHATNGQWRDVAIPLAPWYQNGNIPDTLRMYFTSSTPEVGGIEGSILHVDAVSFTGNSCDVAHITGKVFLDHNQNNIYDSGDGAARNQQVILNGSLLAVTNTLGQYFFAVEPGMHMLKSRLNGQLALFTHGPDSIVVNADTLCGIYGDNNFTITAPNNYCDGQLSTVNPGMPPRPGFIYKMDFSFTNLYSGGPVSPSLRFNYTVAQFMSATPAPDVVDTVNHYLQWNLSNIVSNITWSANIVFTVPSTVPIGQVIQHSSSVWGTGCEGIDSLTDNFETEVVGSYDPNDKSVSPAGVGTNHLVHLNTNQFKYTVRFQNTGNFLAENVRILDTISQHLNINTLKVLTASHPYQVVINGREVAFEFPGIMLPDSNANEPASHGYIQYSIAPANSFMHGTVITNRADIYFDFNAPVLTNTTLSTGSNFLSINDIEDNMLLLYPNPATQLLYIKTENEPAELVRIYNTAGQLVLQVKQPGNMPLDISSLTSGAYMVEVISTKQTVKQRWVKM